MAKKAKKTLSAEKRSKKLTFLIVFICLIMVVVFQLGFLFFIIGMLPSIVSYYIDATRNNLSFQTVCTCNLAGVAPFMADIARSGASGIAIQQVLSNSVSWLIVYSAAAIGWILVFAAPIIAQLMINAIHTRQIARLEKQQRILKEQWGEELETYMQARL